MNYEDVILFGISFAVLVLPSFWCESIHKLIQDWISFRKKWPRSRWCASTRRWRRTTSRRTAAWGRAAAWGCPCPEASRRFLCRQTRTPRSTRWRAIVTQIISSVLKLGRTYTHDTIHIIYPSCKYNGPILLLNDHKSTLEQKFAISGIHSHSYLLTSITYLATISVWSQSQ